MIKKVITIAKGKWNQKNIKERISLFTIMNFAIIFLSFAFSMWTVKYSLTDLNQILLVNQKSNSVVNAIESEITYFDRYIKHPSEENRTELNRVCKITEDKIAQIPLNKNMNDYRYAKTWAIKNSYKVYQEKREEVLELKIENKSYINKLYQVYDMQDYIASYGRTLLELTIDDGMEIYQQKVRMIRFIPFFVSVFGIALVMVMWKLSSSMKKEIVEPIQELEFASKRITRNDYSFPDLKEDRADELRELIHAFNKMKHATNEHITTLDKLHKQELERVELQRRLELTKLELLKNQIKPHFLFNTLNVIGGMAKLEDAPTTDAMIQALSTLFRYNLTVREAEVVVENELYVIKQYMYLQQMRFGKRVCYKIINDVEGNKYKMPAFTLQPIIENSIKHGIGKKEQGGRILIRVFYRQGYLYITITDSGLGITKEKLEAMNKEMENDKDEFIGIGLGSVYKRIKWMYEGKGELKISSKEGVGTSIRIRIPQDVKVKKITDSK